eukprot:14109150-Ditylum_brightwellii.AAC.2
MEKVPIVSPAPPNKMATEKAEMEHQRSKLAQSDQSPALESTGEPVATLEKTDKEEDTNIRTLSAVIHTQTGVTVVNSVDSSNSNVEDIEEETTTTKVNANLERKPSYTSTERNGEEMKEGATTIDGKEHLEKKDGRQQSIDSVNSEGKSSFTSTKRKRFKRKI